MKKRIIVFFIIVLFPFVSSLAQGEDNIWIFGHRIGLDFNTGEPEVVSSSIFSSAGSATMSDGSGNLLFYTDGYWVWNRDNYLMPELTGGAAYVTHAVTGVVGYPPLIAYSGHTANQSATICNKPNSPNSYYVFSNANQRLYFTEINMEQNDGYGGIVAGYKGIPLMYGLSEKMAITRGCHCLWVIVRSMDGNTFYAFEVNDTGVVRTPVVSHIGSLPESWQYGGSMAFSHDGSTLAMVTYRSSLEYSASGISMINGGVELFDFDMISGQFSHNRLLYESDSLGNFYGVCFSPDDSKLYVSYSSHRPYWSHEYGKVIQYDLSSEDTESIIASRSVVYEHLMDGITSLTIGGIRSAPNGKIYFLSRINHPPFNRYIHSIENPNAAGLLCSVNPMAVFVPEFGYHDRGINNYTAVIDSVIWDSSGSLITVPVCFSDSAVLSAPAGGRGYIWHTGEMERFLTVRSSGDYIVSYVSPGCYIAVDTYRVHFHQFPQYSATGYSCTSSMNGQLWVRNRPGDTTAYFYTWRDAYGDLLKEYGSSYGDTLHDVGPGMYYLNIQTSSGCDTLVSMEVLALPDPVAAVVSDSLVCAGDPVLFTADIEHGTVHWDFGDGHNSTAVEAVHIFEQARMHRVMLTVTGVTGCVTTVYKDVYVRDFSIKINVSDTLVHQGEAVRFWVTSPDWFEMNSWSPFHYFSEQSAVVQVASFDTSEWIVAEAANDIGCLAADSVLVRIRPVILMPNVFSPNKDGLNDLFAPVGLGVYTIQSFYVFNRYGQEMFYSFGAPGTVAWDGTYRGAPVEQGVYYYRIVIDIGGPQLITMTGDVTVVR